MKQIDYFHETKCRNKKERKKEVELFCTVFLLSNLFTFVVRLKCKNSHAQQLNSLFFFLCRIFFFQFFFYIFNLQHTTTVHVKYSLVTEAFDSNVFVANCFQQFCLLFCVCVCVFLFRLLLLRIVLCVSVLLNSTLCGVGSVKEMQR